MRYTHNQLGRGRASERREGGGRRRKKKMKKKKNTVEMIEIIMDAA